MKIFKMIDILISLGLITAYVFVNWLYNMEKLIDSYFIVGGWQVISMVVHSATKCFTQAGGIRNIYHWLSFIAVITMPLGSFWILYFLAPFMAVFYTGLCIYETRRMVNRPLALLK